MSRFSNLHAENGKRCNFILNRSKAYAETPPTTHELRKGHPVKRTAASQTPQEYATFAFSVGLLAKLLRRTLLFCRGVAIGNYAGKRADFFKIGVETCAG